MEQNYHEKRSFSPEANNNIAPLNNTGNNSANRIDCGCICFPNMYKRRVDETLNDSRRLLNRTYEDHTWYFLVFKPLNDNYREEIYDKKSLDKVSDFLRKKYNPSVLISTKEKRDCKKVHVNVVMCVHNNFDVNEHNSVKRFYGKYAMVFKVYCQPTDCRHTHLEYAFKEQSKRRFTLYKDYLVYEKK